ncbi:MAG TPA: hypothetical protein VK915_08780 [Gaiellaceae bacterium]|nr:hypothetical protein [Gaiellaceae bacterium]
MKGRDVRDALLGVPVPDEADAGRRSWAVVRGAFEAREPVSRPPRRLRLLVALALLAVLVAAALSPPGRAVGGWVRDRVAGEGDAEPALFRLPAPGPLLVVSEQGPWVVQPDGSKRLLGRYEDASFSPRGLHVVATSARRVVALTPAGELRWSVTRPEPVSGARWAPSGFRVAYLEGETVRVVAGDGTGDRLLAEGAAPVAPAWRPGADENVLAYADAEGRVRVVDADSGEELVRLPPAAGVRALLWTPDGLPVVVTESEVRVHGPRGRLLEAASVRLAEGHEVLDVALVAGDAVYADFDPADEETMLVRAACFARGPCRTIGPRAVFAGAGRLEGLTLSPDGRWLLAAWPDADQLLFLRLGTGRAQRIVAVDDVRREFDPGGTGGRAAPRPAGWCCPAPAQ